MRSPAAAFVAPLLLSLTACGAAAPQAPTAGAPPSSASPAPPQGGSPTTTTERASTVRFDDLGVAFTVPPGYRVLGDEELAARVASAADVRLQRSLRERAKERKGLPLLSLERRGQDASDFLTVSLSVVLVPKDARALEILTAQRAEMNEHLAGFQADAAPTPFASKGASSVDGAQLAARYQVKRGGEARRAASVLRVFVREGVATMAIAVWPEGAAPREEEGRLLLDGLSFYDPKLATQEAVAK